MNKKIIASAIFCAALVAGSSVSAFAQTTKTAKTGQKTEKPKTMVSKDRSLTEKQAEAVALKKYPGTVEKSSTDKYKGNEVFRFDIERKNGAMTDVWINKEGKIVKKESKKEKKLRKNSMKKN
jgi:uncharacterized membrane protein YkoI